MGNTWRDNDFADRAEQLEPDFFSNGVAITLEENPTSHLELSDEAIAEPLVSVTFDADGLAYEEEHPEEPRQDGGLLEPLPTKYGATDWGSAFAETLARVQEMTAVSKPTHIRYDSRGGHVVKFSSLPSASDFVCDVVVVTRKCMSAELYKIFKTVYFDNYGEKSSTVPVAVQILIQQKAGLAFRKAGLCPFGDYWKRRVKIEQIREETLSDLDKVEERKEKIKAARNKRRRARRKAGRPVISTLAA